MSLLTCIFGCFALSFGVASASPSILIGRRPQDDNTLSQPLAPSEDPWYSAPSDFEMSQPGTVLRLRSAPGNLTSVIGNCSDAYNILYRTTDTRYRPSWAVTTLYVPKQTTGQALLSYQMPYNSPNVDYSPSYTFYTEPPPDIALALSRGWYVNVPDHEQWNAADGANIGSGHATLDSVRAVFATQSGLQKDARYAMWGYSGGALASEYAAELQVQYAPELSFDGMAIGGAPPNMTELFTAVDGMPYAALIPLNLVGLTKVYPDSREYLLSVLKPDGPYNRTYFMNTENLSAVQAFAAFANQSIWDYFVNGRQSIEAPLIHNILDDNSYMRYHGVPQMPVFVYKAIHDEVAPIDGVDALVDRYCNIGADILYERSTVGTHLSEMYYQDGSAFEWLSSVLDGTSTAKNGTSSCTIRNVTVSAPNMAT